MSKNIEKSFKKELGKGYVFKLMKYFLPYKKIIINCVILIILSLLVGIVTPKINSFLTESIIPNKQISTFILVIIVIAVLEFVNIFAEFYKTKLINKYGYEIIGKIRNDIFNKLTKVSMEYFNQNATGSLIGKSTSYVDSIASFYTSYIFTLIEHSIRICIVVPCLFICSPILTLICLASLIPIGALVYFVIKVAKKRSNAYSVGQSASFDGLAENIDGVATLTSFNKEEENLGRYLTIVKRNYKEWYALSRINDTYYLIFDTIYNLFLGGIYIYSFVLILNGNLQFATFVAFLGYNSQLWTPLNYFVQLFNSFNSLTGNLRQVFSTLEAEEKVADTNYAKNHKLKGNITVKNLSFSYENENVLKNVNFKVAAGQKVVLCGLSNSGKSTIIELIGRLYDFNSGTIFLDEVNIKSIKLKSIRENIGIVQQNSFIMSDTIMNNLKLGNEMSKEEDCIKACELIGANDFINTMGGYNTIIGKEGFELSDGEKQLIDVARLIIKNPNIIIYDEALNSLTPKRESEIVENLKNFFKDKTMLIVTNNKYIIKNSDYVYYLKNGTICEHGKYEELVNNKKEFFNDIID